MYLPGYLQFCLNPGYINSVSWLIRCLCFHTYSSKELNSLAVASGCLATLGPGGEGSFLACIAAPGKGVHFLRSPHQMCVLLQLHTLLLSTSKYFGFSLQFGEMQRVLSLLFHWGLFFIDCSF